MKQYILVLFSMCVVFVWCVPSVFAEWTPLVTSGMFTGMTTDVSTVVTAMITIFVILLAFGILIRVFTR